jgi:hypothetical protein
MELNTMGCGCQAKRELEEKLLEKKDESPCKKLAREIKEKLLNGERDDELDAMLRKFESCKLKEE